METSVNGVIDLDLNEEPNDPDQEAISGRGSFRNQIEAANGEIEDRLRQIEAVTARTRRSRRRRNISTPSESPYSSNAASNESYRQRNSESKEIGTQLIAKALEMDEIRTKGDGEGFFDCNVCLNMAKDPILTCCGHLFCWPCFYNLPYVHSDARECPACRGVVSDGGVTPIYGCDKDIRLTELRGVPARPEAHRIENRRQNREDAVLHSLSVEDAMLVLRPRIGGLRFARTEESDLQRSGRASSGGSRPLMDEESESGIGVSSVRFMRLLSEGTASLTSLSSALLSVQRLVEDLEGIIQSQPSSSHGGTPQSRRRR